MIAWKGVREIVIIGDAGPAPVAPDPLGFRLSQPAQKRA